MCVCKRDLGLEHTSKGVSGLACMYASSKLHSYILFIRIAFAYPMIAFDTMLHSHSQTV